MKKNSKKIVSFLLVVIMSITMFVPVFANDEISVYLDNEKIQFDVAPLLVNGRTMVPMRAIFEKLGAVVYWDNNTRTAIAQKGNVNVSIAIDDITLYKNGEPIVLDVPAQLNGGRTLVPLRAVSEAFECDVQWNGDTQTVNISSNNNFNSRQKKINELRTWISKNYNHSLDNEIKDFGYLTEYGSNDFKVSYDADSSDVKVFYVIRSSKENIGISFNLSDLQFMGSYAFGTEFAFVDGYIGGSIYSNSLELIETFYKNDYDISKDIISEKIREVANISLKAFDTFLKSNNLGLTLKDFDLDYDLSSVDLPQDTQQEITFEALRGFILYYQESENSDKAEMVKVYEGSNGSTQYSMLYDDKKDIIRLTNTRIYKGSYTYISIDLTPDNQVYECSFYFAKSKSSTPDFEAAYVIDAKTFGENSNINFENIKGIKTNTSSYKEVAKLMSLDMLDYLDWVFSLGSSNEFSTSDFGFNLK